MLFFHPFLLIHCFYSFVHFGMTRLRRQQEEESLKPSKGESKAVMETTTDGWMTARSGRVVPVMKLSRHSGDKISLPTVKCDVLT